jgi:hypothetical protein
VRINRINADAVDSDSVCSRYVVPGPKLGQLARSTTGEIKHIEKEDESFVLSESFGKGELIATCGRQLEFRRPVTDG